MDDEIDRPKIKINILWESWYLVYAYVKSRVAKLDDA